MAASLQATALRQPPAIACNVCQAALTEVSAVDTQRLRGIELAFQAHCPACDQDTWAVRGEPAAVRAFYAALEKAAGQPVQMGTAKPATAD
ncbi:MAG: hypothetical protein Q8K45_10455 [Rubrivivax sp.]|nr:hypothetical protein [Rubrivivax sp.]